MALTDGFFIANEAGELDLSHHHGLITDAVLGAAARLADRSSSVPEQKVERVPESP